MRHFTKYHIRLKRVRELAFLGIAAVAALFLPEYTKYEPTGINVYDLYVNGTAVGCTQDLDQAQSLLLNARKEYVKDSEELIFLTAELTYEGRSMTWGTVDEPEEISERMLEVISASAQETLQRAYTVKINEYTVNLADSGEVIALLEAALAQYDEAGEFLVNLVVDPDRELNVLTTQVVRQEEEETSGQTQLGAGVELLLEDIMEAAGDAVEETFETIEYGLLSIDFADTVEVVEAYLPADQLTDLETAISEVTKEQEKETIYEVVSGDTLSQIALDNGLSLDELIAMNEGIEDENSVIRVGDEITVTVPEPELSVIRQELVYEEDSYDAEVEYIDMDDWYTTEEEVVQQPSAGYRKTASIKTYRNNEEEEEEILLEEIEYEAVPKIVKKGTITPPTYIKPVSGGTLSSSFGTRSSPTAGASTNHKGVDWAVPIGTAVMASSGGTVTRAGWVSGYGYAVYIQHPDGKETRYGHLSKILVSVGQTVEQGEKIALSGNTGRSTGPHLHFEIRVNGTAVNPLNYLS